MTYIARSIRGMLPPELGIDPIELIGEDIDPFTDRHVWAPSRVPDLTDWVCPYLTDPNDDDREVDEDGVPILAAEVRTHGVCTTYSETLTEIPLDRVHYVGQARPKKVVDVAAAMEGRRRMVPNTIGTVMSRGECWESHNWDGVSETPEVDDDGYLATPQTESVMLASAEEHFDGGTASLINMWRDLGNPDEMPRRPPSPVAGAAGGAVAGRGGGEQPGAARSSGRARGELLAGWNKTAIVIEVALVAWLVWWLVL